MKKKSLKASFKRLALILAVLIAALQFSACGTSKNTGTGSNKSSTSTASSTPTASPKSTSTQTTTPSASAKPSTAQTTPSPSSQTTPSQSNTPAASSQPATAQASSSQPSTASAAGASQGGSLPSVPKLELPKEYVLNSRFVDHELQLTDKWPLDGKDAISVVKDSVTGLPVASVDKGSALAWSLYDGRYIYVYVDVNDATPLINKLSKADLYRADGIEISLATDAKTYRKFIISKNADSGEIMCATRPLKQDQTDPASGTYAFESKKGGYIFKGKFDTQNEEINFIKLNEMNEILFELWVDYSENGTALAGNVAWKGSVNKREEHGKMVFAK